MKSELYCDLAVIGGGPGGMAAATKAYELGIKDIVLIEREPVLGGILPQCIHNGFGLHVFKKQLTGPEYGQIFRDRINNIKIKILKNTMALTLNIDQDRGKKRGRNNSGISWKKVVVTSERRGIQNIAAKAVILALGCRERTRGQIAIPGSRPPGVYTAGLVQRMVNIEGYLPGKDIVILGSGDIGLIMARRLKLEGCNVRGVYELMPFSAGLARNVAQCLEDYNIPLYLNNTVTNIYGYRRIEAVEVSKVDDNLEPIKNTGCKVYCDALILSVGLVPENELSKTCDIKIDENTNGPIVDENLQTSVEGIFACGNSLYVNDIVDNVTEDGYLSAQSAFLYLNKNLASCPFINISKGENINYIVPQNIDGDSDVLFRIRVKYPIRNAYVKFGNINFIRKVKYALPGELIFIEVKKKYFKDLIKSGKDFIRISVSKTPNFA
jgi:NADPH-dependent 2,4-dienoyl-CoA reductase/sulfur reductase-like enzyme